LKKAERPELAESARLADAYISHH